VEDNADTSTIAADQSGRATQRPPSTAGGLMVPLALGFEDPRVFAVVGMLLSVRRSTSLRGRSRAAATSGGWPRHTSSLRMSIGSDRFRDMSVQSSRCVRHPFPQPICLYLRRSAFARALDKFSHVRFVFFDTSQRAVRPLIACPIPSRSKLSGGELSAQLSKAERSAEAPTSSRSGVLEGDLSLRFSGRRCDRVRCPSEAEG
jgi:hypothetical protein